MAATSTSIQRVRISDISPARKISTGVVEVLVALFIFAVFARTVSAGSITTFVMTPGGITTGQMGNWVIPSQLTLYLLAALSLVIGLFQLIRGFGKITNLMVGLVFLFFIFSFLTWQAADKSLNLAGMLSSAVGFLLWYLMRALRRGQHRH